MFISSYMYHSAVCIIIGQYMYMETSKIQILTVANATIISGIIARAV